MGHTKLPAGWLQTELSPDFWNLWLQIKHFWPGSVLGELKDSVWYLKIKVLQFMKRQVGNLHPTRKYTLHTQKCCTIGACRLLKVKQNPAKKCIAIRWLTSGQQIFPGLPVAICLPSFLHSFHSLFQTCVATYLPGKESLTYSLCMMKWQTERSQRQHH